MTNLVNVLLYFNDINAFYNEHRIIVDLIDTCLLSCLVVLFFTAYRRHKIILCDKKSIVLISPIISPDDTLNLLLLNQQDIKEGEDDLRVIDT